MGGVGGIWSVRERLSIRNPQLNEPCQTRVCQSHMKYQNWSKLGYSLKKNVLVLGKWNL